jgi:trimethylamine--corrinoid protein Co-methyltransferase
VLSLQSALKAEDIRKIHAQSLDVLDSVGIDYKTPRALEVLEQYGCQVEYDKTWARIPSDLVEWAVEQSPRNVVLHARNPEHDVYLDGGRSHHTTDSQGTQAIDLETGKIHDSCSTDLDKMLLLADALDNTEIVNISISASDVPAHLRTIYHFCRGFTLTDKHIRTGVLNARQVPYLVEMTKIVTGSDSFQPIFSAVDCTISPLMHDGSMTEACIELARLGVPILVYPMPLAGGTSPVTLGGTILLHNIEFLSGLVLFQCANPGTPIVYGTGASQLDMQTGRYGGSANGVGMGCALLNMARYYGLPANLWGLSTKSKQLDAQYGFEAIAAALLATLAGADEIYGLGLLGEAQIFSLEKMVIDNHLISQIGHMVTPIRVDDESLQVNLIKEVGIGGEYLTKKDTLKFTRSEYVPRWPPYGTELIELATKEALDILRNHTPPSLPLGANDDMEMLLKEADACLNI